MLCLHCVCGLAEGTFGAAVTFVCGEQETDTLQRFAELCNMYICPLPGDFLAVIDWLLLMHDFLWCCQCQYSCYIGFFI